MSSPRRMGLPAAVRMRHDTHFVEELARPSGIAIGRLIPIEDIQPNPHQPRQTLGDLAELTASIQEKGVLEPILVRPMGSRFQIIAEIAPDTDHPPNGLIGRMSALFLLSIAALMVAPIVSTARRNGSASRCA